MDRKVKQLKVNQNDLLLQELMDELDPLPILQDDDLTAARIAAACNPPRGQTNIKPKLDAMVAAGKLKAIKKRMPGRGFPVTVYVKP